MRENRDLLELIVEHESPSVRPIAAALLLAVELEDARKRRDGNGN